MRLIVQTGTPGRTVLYLLGCTTPACASSSSAWVALRWMAQEGPPPRRTKPGEDAADDDEDCGWGGEDPDVDDLKELLSGLGVARTGERGAAGKVQPQSPERDAAGSGSEERDCFSAYRITLRPERRVGDQVDEHVEALLAEYAAREESWGPEAWEEEEEDDEKDDAVAWDEYRAVLDASPGQCVRISPGGSPAWPGRTPPDFGPCGGCGAARVFEMQVVSELLYAWRDEGADALEWTTVVVATCPARCAAGGAATADGGCMWVEAAVAFGEGPPPKAAEAV